jgi:succinate dehydrogenase / fumarate reductase cytochrome b subunit
MVERPLSPHLSIWKWGPAMLVSILHRVTGDGMAFVALPVLLWWLGSLASGPEAYATFTWAATSIPGYVVLVGISWAFFNHFCSGVRHFVLDIGAGYEVDRNNRWSVVTIAGGIVLTAAFWAAIVLL